MIEGIEFAQYQIDWFRQPEVPHVTGYDPERQTETPGLLAGQAAHRGGDIDAVHPDPFTCQRERRRSCSTCQVAGRFKVRQDPAKHLLSGRFVPRQVKCEELVVIFRQ